MSKTFKDKMASQRVLDGEVDTTLRKKGGSHSLKYTEPEVCLACGGVGYIRIDNEVFVCDYCYGEGELT